MAGLGANEHQYTRPVPTYYRDAGVDQTVLDFDDKRNFDTLELRAQSEATQNFFIDFSHGQHSQAWSAFDVRSEAWSRLLLQPRPDAFDTRWINIWAPQNQPELIGNLAKKYGFSPRLTGLMQAQPLRRTTPGGPQSPTSPRKTRGRLSSDLEKSLHSSTDASQQDVDPIVDLNHYDVVSQIWHWSTVDLGSKYLCIGYNTLHNVSTASAGNESEDDKDRDLPNGVRIWNWLILGNDKTVITITEDKTTRINPNKYRKNLINVFRQLSMSTDPMKRSAISLVPIRYDIGEEDPGRSNATVDGAGLLFYYLFDDWHETYRLLAKKENGYRIELSRLRDLMRDEAKLSHVDELHHIGRQLSTLLRLYKSYEMIIGRILEKQTPPPLVQSHHFSTPASTVQPTPGSPAPQSQEPTAERPAISLSMSNTDLSRSSPDQLGVFLTSSARLRFERLRDRINLYAISEIQECIELKDSLVMMNFNLITIRESNSVERLTRITILLAKVTILFLPVSLMTSYFSVQIPDAHFTIKAYWIAFAVVAVLSFLLIWIFGKISGTVEGQMVYNPLHRVLIDIGKAFVGRGRTKET